MVSHITPGVKTGCCKNGALSRISGPTEEVTRALKNLY